MRVLANMRSRPRVTSSALGLAVGISLTVVPIQASQAEPVTDEAPNIVVILTDDQPKGMLPAMPNLLQDVVPNATTYTTAVVPTSVCCPSRSSLLTGKYSNETGVFGTTPKKYGGWKTFADNGNEDKTIAVTLSEAGYATGLFGKYLNGYDPSTGDLRPPGWNRWNALVDSSPNKYDDFSFTADEPGLPLEESLDQPIRTLPNFGSYSTTLMGEATASFIEEVPEDQPLFAVYTPYGPHAPFTPEPQYAGTGIEPPWSKADITETDVSDKPKWVRKQRAKARVDGMTPQRAFKRGSATLRSVDDEVGRIVQTLKDTDRWDNTLLVFTSDNGFAYGQNRVVQKNNPYRPASEVDLIVKYPDQQTAKVSQRLVTPNIDVAATALLAAGLPNSTSGDHLDSITERAGIPVMGSVTKIRNARRPPYCGWRTESELYVKYATKEEEYYDYRIDPEGKRNLLRPPAKKGNPKRKPGAKRTVQVKPRVVMRVATLHALAAEACVDLTPDFGTFDYPHWIPKPLGAATDD